MKIRGSGFLPVIALFAGLGVGYCFGLAGGGDKAPAPAEKSKVPRHAPADVGEAASLKALRARVAELERMLSDSEARRPAAETNAVAVALPGGAPRPGAGPREWMENLKKNDPARFAQMTNRFAQFRRRRMERQQRNLDFLASVDTSTMSASAKKTHSALQDAITRREELEEKMHQENLSDDDRQALFNEMRETDHQLRRLRRAERNNLFEATATTLGFEGDDAKEIVSTLNEVVEATESSWRSMRPPHDPPPQPRN